MALKPRFVVLDEPTSALDKTVQAQIVELLLQLQERHGLAYLFISHDLKVVRALASELIVMKEGLVVEQGPAQEVFAAPQEPYTRALIAAAFDIEAIEDGERRVGFALRRIRGIIVSFLPLVAACYAVSYTRALGFDQLQQAL